MISQLYLPVTSKTPEITYLIGTNSSHLYEIVLVILVQLFGT